MLSKFYRNFSSNLPVSFSYSELLSNEDLSEKILQAFGSSGLGLCTIREIPEYALERKTLLPLAYSLSVLPASEKEKIESPKSFYSRGWSEGKMVYKGKTNPELGEFHASPEIDDHLEAQYKNLWPEDSLPQLRPSFISLYNTIKSTCLLLTNHLDRFIEKKFPNSKISVTNTLKISKYSLGDLLHYYPVNTPWTWNRWHTDHSILTALTCPIYIDESTGAELEGLDLSNTGLFVRNRKSEVIKISTKQDELCVQIGDVIQLVSGGILQATPHTVLTDGKLGNVSRNTLAIFLEPEPNFSINCPDEKNAIIEHEGIRSLLSIWHQGMKFKEFSANNFK